MSAAAAPTVTVDPASSIGFTSVKATGEVDPGEKETFCHFEYVSDKQLEENEANGDPGFTNAAVAGCDVEPLTGNTSQPVAANLENLTSATTYHLRLVASNEDGTEVALAPNFTTQTATPPALALDPPSGVSYTKAHISGTVDPEGGNVNPIGGPTPIVWQLEVNSQGFWEWVEGGVIQEAEAESSSPIAVSKDLEFLPPNTNFKFRLKAFYTGREETRAGGEFTTLAVSQPTVVADDATSVTGTSAHFSGTVTAGGEDPAFDTNCTFDYVTDAQFQIDEFASASQIGCDVNPVTGTASTPVAADPTDLQPNTTYHLRLRGENAGGQSTSAAPDTFTTEAIAPTVVDAFAIDVTQSSATLNAKIRPGGIPATYHFEYLTLAQFEANGETFAGASQTPESASIGADNSVHQVSANISGLQLGTPYRFRVVATNAQSGPGGTPGAVAGFTTSSTAAGQSCPNEQLRIETNSTALPDCRAYELVTPDLNHASIYQSTAVVSSDGEQIRFGTVDAPLNASVASVLNVVRATRAADGWSTEGLGPKLTKPLSGYFSAVTQDMSADGTAILGLSDQPLGSAPWPSGQNLYVWHADGSYSVVTTVGAPYLNGLYGYIGAGAIWGSSDYSQLFFGYTFLPQFPAEFTGETSYYWSEKAGAQLYNYLPDGSLAPDGAVPAFSNLRNGLQPASDDGRYLVYNTGMKVLQNASPLYLRDMDDSSTIRVDETQRTVNPDPNPQPDPVTIGITPDGSTILFTSKSELTNDANTGETGGISTDAGNDLYSYDTSTKELTDLTVDTNPADAATGADVGQVMAVTKDASYIYFTANGVLAPGAAPGHTSLYVWHNGDIKYVTLADRMKGLGYGFYITPDGQHFTFASADSLTGYDNRDPVTGTPHLEVFKGSLGSSIECASCRPNGTRPTVDSSLPTFGRTLSDDGKRVFFESADAVLPQASDGKLKVFEFSDSRPALISSGVSSGTTDFAGSRFMGASADGSHVFFKSYDEVFPFPNGGDFVIYDAVVNGGFPIPKRVTCSGAECQGSATPALAAGSPASSTLSGPGNLRRQKSCAKNRVRRGGKCVKKHRAHKKKHRATKRGNRSGRASGGSK